MQPTRNTPIMWMLVVAMGLFFACSKNDERTAAPQFTHAFTNLPDTADSRLITYADSLLAREATRLWMDSVLTTIGTPAWEYATFGKQAGVPAAMVPLIDREAREVRGLLVMVNGPDGFRFRVLDTRKPERYGYNNGRNRVGARHIFIAADLFNQRIFARAPREVLDHCMMTRSERRLLDQARRTGPAGTYSIRTAAYTVSITCYTTVACTGDGKGNCVGNIVTTTDCVYNYIWVDYGGGGYVGPSGGVTGGGGGASGPAGGCVGTEYGGEDAVVVMPPDKPINDVIAYLKCFSRTTGGKITFYADQPVAGTSKFLSIKELVGHAYISIEQNVGGIVIRRAIGFHPEEGVSAVFNTSAPSKLGDDSNIEYDVKYTVNVTAATMGKVLTMILNPKPVYHIESYNCTNFVLDVSDACGLQIPRTKGQWFFGSGVNPGNFGQDLRKIVGAEAGKHYSPINAGNCN